MQFEVFYMAKDFAAVELVQEGWTWCLVDEDAKLLGWARKTFATKEAAFLETNLVKSAETVERPGRAKLA